MLAMSWIKNKSWPVAIVLIIATVFVVIEAHRRVKDCESAKIEVHKKTSSFNQASIDSLNFTIAIAAYKEQINVKEHEIIRLQERNALLVNDSLDAAERLRAINEYIRTGRLPSAGALRKKFKSDP